MASGTLTLSTQSVDYGGGRGGMSMTNTINWSTSGNTLTLSNGGRSGGDYWTLYNATGASDYLVVLKVQVNYGSGWTTISEQSAYIGTVAQGGLRIDTKSEEFLNNLGSYTLTGNCSLRALYYATYAPVPTPDYPYAFPNESYSEASQTPVVVDVVVAPDTPTITNVSFAHNSITCDWGTTSFGTPSTGTIHLCCTSTSTSGTAYSVLSKTTTGSSTSTITQYVPDGSSTAINLVPNSIYFVSAIADNGSASSNSSITRIQLAAEPPSVSVGTVTETSIEVNYSTVADGGSSNKWIEYSLNGTNWIPAATLSGGTAQSGSYTITGLNPATQYTIHTRVTTMDLISGRPIQELGATLTVTTSGASGAVLYGSKNTNGLAKKLIKVYAPVSGLSKSLKVYGAVAGQGTVGVTGTIRSGGAGNVTAFDGDTFWAKFTTSSAYDVNKTVWYISLPSPAGTPLTTFADIHYTDNTYKRITTVNTASLAEYGITYSSNPVSGSDYIDLTPISGTVYTAKLIHEK